MTTVFLPPLPICSPLPGLAGGGFGRDDRQGGKRPYGRDDGPGDNRGRDLPRWDTGGNGGRSSGGGMGYRNFLEVGG